MTTHVLQGFASCLGWVDMNACKSELEARAHLEAALHTPGSWANGSPRRDYLRIVPVSESNCVDQYLKSEEDSDQ